MNWIKIDSKEAIAELKTISMNERVMLFKFKPECSINHVMKLLLEREWAEGEMKMNTYLLDVVSNKDVAGAVADEFGVEHESPQAMIIKGGKAEFVAAYGKIHFSELRKFANCKG